MDVVHWSVIAYLMITLHQGHRFTYAMNGGLPLSLFWSDIFPRIYFEFYAGPGFLRRRSTIIYLIAMIRVNVNMLVD